MKIGQMDCIDFDEEDAEVREILRDLLRDMGHAYEYSSMTFYDDGDDDNWTHGYVTAENKKIVDAWLTENKVARDEEFILCL